MTIESNPEVARVNVAAVEGALRDMQTKLFDQDKKIVGLVSTISTLQGELAGMNQRLAIMHASSIGTGPTVVE